MRIAGNWFARGSAAFHAATLEIEGDRVQLMVDGDVTHISKLSDIKVLDRIGNVERKLILPDGSLFATHENQVVDDAFARQIKSNRLIHTIESNLAWAAVALALAIVTTFAFVRWGLPWASHTIAHALPHKVGDAIGASALQFLDEYLFSESKISKEDQKSIRTHFDHRLTGVVPVAENQSLRLHFRAWGDDDVRIPNALALPSGDIILTDRLIELSENQSEIDAVLLHEIGHIEHRHTLEMVAQSTFVAVVLASMTGDASGFSDLGIGLGSLLITAGYSRKFETEADEFAFERMLRLGIDPQSFETIMTKITNDMLLPGERKKTERTAENDETGILDYLSTHPRTQARIALAKRYAKCFELKMLVCDPVLHRQP